MIKIVPCRLTKSFEELDGSPTFSLSRNPVGLAATRQIKCAAVDAIQLSIEFLGYTTIHGIDVVYHRPHAITEIYEYLEVVNVAAKPFGKMKDNISDTRFAVYDYVQLTISYKVPQREESEAYGGIVTINETLQPASEFLTLPSKNLFWGTGDDKEALDVAAAPAKILSMTDWLYNVKEARAIPPELWQLAGKINSKNVTSTTLGEVFPVGTLLFTNPVIDKERTFDGMRYDITLRIIYKNNGVAPDPKGWNYYPHTSKEGTEVSWEKITDGTNEKEFYTEADFGDVIV